MSKAVLLLLGLACTLTIAKAQGDWKAGRGTMYGADAWSIHQGSCAYGYIREDEPLGWNVAALPDVSPYYVDSCGTCFEVRCNPSSFTDGYGEYLDRSGACYDPEASLVFRITDTCPCVYPTNAYSNKRWCCGDSGLEHFDLSIWGFERLADTKWGVIGLQFRPVPCSYRPAKEAPRIANPTPGEQPPNSWNNKAPIRDWPDVANTTTTVAYDGGLQGGWQEVSYNVQGGNYMQGVVSGTAKCYNVQPKGAFAFKAWNGAFESHIGVEVWVYMGTATVIEPGVILVIGGETGDCQAVDLRNVKPTGFKPRCTSCIDYWWKWEVYFSAFANLGAQSIINNARFFKGCGGNPPSQLNYIEVRNYRQSSENLCIDRVVLV